MPSFDPENPPTLAAPKGLIDDQIVTSDYLFGIPLDNFSVTCGKIPPSVWQRTIDSSYAWLETELAIDILPKTILDETKDYRRDDYLAWAFFNLNRRPVLSVYRIRAVWPTSNPDQGIEFPAEWIKLSKSSGQVNLVPGGGSIATFIIGQSGAFLPLVYSGAWDYLPQLFHIDYAAGMSTIPADINDVVGKRVANEVFKIVSSLLFPPGMSNISLGVDGVSQSIGLTRSVGQLLLSDRINQYEKDIAGQLPALKQKYSGYPMTVA